MNPTFPLVCCIVLAGCQQAPSTTTAEKVKEYSIEQFYANTNVIGSAFSPDETKLLINSNQSGIYNLYELSIADSSMKPLTQSTKESYFSDDYLPGTTSFIYNADKGGDENSHLYLQRPGDTAAIDLTPWKGSANSLLGWSSDKKSMFVSSNKRDPKFFDFWELDTSSWKPTLLYKNDAGLLPSQISKSKRFICLNKEITTDKNELYLYDRTTKKMKRLSNDNEAVWYPAVFEKSDSVLYYITNDGNEFTYVVKYDIGTGATTKIFETNWDVMDVSLSEKENYMTILVNEDAKNKIVLLDHHSNKPIDFPTIQDGDIRTAKISPTEKNMLLTVGGSTTPNNLYVYNFETKNLKQLTRTLNKEVNQSHLSKAEVIRFKSFDGLEIPSILYKPLSASKENKAPAILWIHGGPGGQSQVRYSNDIQFLVNHGYAVLAVNNRGSSGYGKKFYKMDNKDHSNGDLKDCVWAKKWLQQQEYIDSSKIGIEGGSYGGSMVLGALAFHPDEFKAGVDLFGVANWPRTLKNVPPYWEAFKKALYDELGDPNTADSVRLRKISALFNYEKITKPLIVFQGMNDVRVLPIESEEIVAGVKKNGVPVEYVTYPDEGHGFLKKENQMTTARRTLAFLDKYLKGSPDTTASGRLN